MRQPLANDANGIAFELPENARKWRLQRNTGKKGRQRTLYFDGVPLEIEIDASPAEFRQKLENAGYPTAGRFRLQAVDGNGDACTEKIAVVEWEGTTTSDSGDEEDSGSTNGGLLRAIYDMAKLQMNRDDSRDKWIVQRDEHRDRSLGKMVDTVTQLALQLAKGYSHVLPVVEEMAEGGEPELQPAEPSLLERLQGLAPLFAEVQKYAPALGELFRNAATAKPTPTEEPARAVEDGPSLGIPHNGASSNGVHG